jgi:AAA domain
MDFFDRTEERSPEVVQGLFREGQIIVLGGLYGVGKSPLFCDLSVHLIHGFPWCGLAVNKRPVIYLDFENRGQTFRENIRQTCRRLCVSTPCVPQDLDPYIWNDCANESGTKELLEVMRQPHKVRMGFLKNKLAQKPNALLIIDPIEMFIPIDSTKKVQVLTQMTDFRFLLGEFPNGSVALTYNLRKKDRRLERPSLLTNPREWLDEIAGSSDIMNRSDVRLGMDFYEEDEVRVINGIWRGELMEPLLIEPIFHGQNPAGFKRVEIDRIIATGLLTEKQRVHWNSLPEEFTFEQGKQFVPGGSLSRLTNRAQRLCLMTHEGNKFRKVMDKI